MATIVRDGSDDDQDEQYEEGLRLNLDTRLGNDGALYENIQPGTRYKDLIIKTIVEDGEEENVPILVGPLGNSSGTPLDGTE